MLKTLRNSFFSGIAAGVMIGIGGAVYLACCADASPFGKYAGAVLFSVALLTICACGMYLYTGKICYALDNLNRSYLLSLTAGIAGNYVGALLCGILTGISNPVIYERARLATEAKLGLEWYRVIIAGFLCDILIFAAVHIYKTKNSAAGIFIAIPTFILCGFEHSIADMYYVSTALSFTPETVGFILLVILGNTLGGLFIPLLLKLAGSPNK